MSIYLQVYVTPDTDREAVRDNMMAMFVAAAVNRLTNLLAVKSDPFKREFGIRVDNCIMTDVAGPHCFFMKLHWATESFVLSNTSQAENRRIMNYYCQSLLHIPGVHSIIPIRGDLATGQYYQFMEVFT
jgi:hypothetical protein